MEISNIPICIRINSIVGGIGTDVHHFLKLRMITQLGSGKALCQSIYRIPIDFGYYPFIIKFVRHWTMMRAIHGKRFFLDLASYFILDRNRKFSYSSAFLSIFVGQFSFCLCHILHKFIDKIHSCGGMHPSCFFIESLIDKKLSPSHCAIGIQAFFTDHMDFWSEIKRSVRIDK